MANKQPTKADAPAKAEASAPLTSSAEFADTQEKGYFGHLPPEPAQPAPVEESAPESTPEPEEG